MFGWGQCCGFIQYICSAKQDQQILTNLLINVIPVHSWPHVDKRRKLQQHSLSIDVETMDTNITSLSKSHKLNMSVIEGCLSMPTQYTRPLSKKASHTCLSIPVYYVASVMIKQRESLTIRVRLHTAKERVKEQTLEGMEQIGLGDSQLSFIDLYTLHKKHVAMHSQGISKLVSKATCYIGLRQRCSAQLNLQYYKRLIRNWKWGAHWCMMFAKQTTIQSISLHRETLKLYTMQRCPSKTELQWLSLFTKSFEGVNAGPCESLAIIQYQGP